MTQEQLIDYAITMGCAVKVRYADAEVEILPPEKPVPKTPPKPKAEKKAKVKPAGKPEIDEGKIRVLKAAGWSVAKIADEIGCSEQTVANHLKKEGLRA